MGWVAGSPGKMMVVQERETMPPLIEERDVNSRRAEGMWSVVWERTNSECEGARDQTGA